LKLPVFAIYIDTKKLATYTVLAFILGGLLGGAMWNFGGVYIPELPPSNLLVYGSLMKFASEAELVRFLETMPSRTQEIHGMWGGLKSRGFLAPFASNVLEADTATTASGQGATDYSGTNIQVEGVDEADMVKTDGEHIYLARDSQVFIVKAWPPEDAGVTATLDLERGVSDLFINGDKLVVISSPESFYYWGPIDVMPPKEYELTTNIWVYDVSDRSSPTLDRTVDIKGYYTSSRMIGDYVYAITGQPAILNNTEPILPTIRSGNYTCEVEATDIWYANNTDYYYGYTNIVALDVQDPESEITHETYLMGSSSSLYVSMENIYLTAPWWVQDEVSGWETTKIFKINVDEESITYVAEGIVPGRVLNQFSMDEYDGYFRIATTNGHVSRSGSSTSNNVYVLNASLGVAGSLEGLAPGEEIYSARFMGGRCYLVTFKKVDPLFVIDLADPEDPKVLGKLKIPGYSDYLHPYDENTLIGVGKETEEAEEGDFAWYQGVKISLFDVSNVSDPKELDKIEIGDRGTDSQALYDHKAFLFSWAKNLLVIPVLEAKIDAGDYSGEVPPNAHGEYVYQGAYVFHVSREQGIELKGRVTHIEDPQAFLKSGYWFESELSVERSLYIDDMLYTISGKMIMMNALSDLSEAGRVDLP
jgi:inhibitor of cysteine peptidase